MGTIPRAEIRAIAERYRDDLLAGLTEDPSVRIVRQMSENLRVYADDSRSINRLAEAKELDALADRYEREGA